MTTQVLIKRLRKRIKRGALSRIAEYCGVSPTTVRNWVDGLWMPGAQQRPFLMDVATGKVDLTPKKTGPKGARKTHANGAKEKFRAIGNNS